KKGQGQSPWQGAGVKPLLAEGRDMIHYYNEERLRSIEVRKRANSPERAMMRAARKRCSSNERSIAKFLSLGE
ncbi:MAG: hypothetical protein RSA55_08670, partial [Clostridia bacterium]